MTKEQKEAFVADFREKAEQCSAMYLTDFTGLDVKAMTILRGRLKAAGCEYVVVKNRLAKRALDEAGMTGLLDSLIGPTGAVFTSNGVVEAAKSVAEFAKEHDGKPVFKSGVMEGKMLEPAAVARLAELPSRDALLSMLAGVLAGPTAALASALEAKKVEMAGLFEALRDTKSRDGKAD